MITLLKKRSVKICLGIAVILVLFFVLLPVGIKYYLISYIEKNGAEKASIETLSINPFLGRIRLGGLDIQGSDHSILHHTSLVIDIGLSSLFDRDILLERAEYSDLFIDMEQYEDGRWRYGSFTIEGGVKSEESTESPEKTLPKWGFRADNAVMNNCSFHLKTPQVDMTLLIERAELQRFTTREGEEAGIFTLTGKIDDSPIAINLDTLQVVPDIRIDGDVSITDFDLHELSQILEPVLPVINGMFGINGKILFTLSDADGIHVDYNGTASVKAADLGSDVFTTTSEAFTWDGKITYSAPISQPAELITDGLLSVRNIDLQLPSQQLTYTNAAIDLQGKNQLTLGESITLENDGSLSLKDVDLQIPTIHLKQHGLNWKGKIGYETASGVSKINSDGDLGFDGIHFVQNTPQSPLDFQGQKVTWAGNVAVILNGESGQTSIEIDGALQGATLHTSLMEPPILLAQERLNLKSKASLSLGEKLGISAKSSLEIGSFTLQQGDDTKSMKVGFDTLAINGLENSGINTLSAADLHTTNITATVPGNLPLNITIADISLKTIHTDDLVNIALASFALEGLQATSSQNNSQLASLKQLTMADITSGKETLFSAQDIDLTGLTLLAGQEGTEQKPVLSLGSANISTLRYAQETGLAGDTIDLKTLLVMVDKDKDGELNINQRLKAMQLSVPEAAPETSAEEKQVTSPVEEKQAGQSPGIRVKAITIGNDSTISFSDQTLTMPYSTNLKITEFSLNDLDSTQPDKKANLLLDGTLEEKAPIRITGTIAPFKTNPDINLDLVLKNYPLSSLSPYTVQAIGTALASGQLRVKSQLALSKNVIDLKNNVILVQLETKTISPELAAELSNQLPVPLDAALAMMRDGDGNITLDIPISGPLDDINVGITQIIVTALNKSIVSAASSYFVYALGPYAALAYVGMKVGEEMLQVDLPPVVYQPQEIILTEDHKGYLERIAKILTDKPDQDLRLTPKVAAWELYSEEERAAFKAGKIKLDTSMQKQLQELGQQRLENIQIFLTNNHGIDKIRILAGDVAIDVGKDAQPMVQVEIK